MVSVSILGCGWLGASLAQRLVGDGVQVFGSTTQVARFAALRAIGVSPLLLRIDGAGAASATESGDQHRTNENLKRFFSSDTLLVSIPPDTSFGAEFHNGEISEILDFVSEYSVKRVIYVSSTSVYGPTQGEVDEKVEPRAESGSGAILRKTETRLAIKAREKNFSFVIVRPGGLIGPGRHPGRFFGNKTDVPRPDEPVNLVHQTDVVECLEKIVRAPGPASGTTEIYNVVARTHPTRREFYSITSLDYGLKPPQFTENSDLTRGSKIVLAEKIRKDLGAVFRFDDLYSAFTKA